MNFTSEEKREIEKLMELGSTREEAEQCILDDREDIETEEMKQMAKNAKSIMKNARSVDAYGKKRVRERQPNEAKRELIQLLFETMQDADLVTKAEITNVEKVIDLELTDGTKASISLTFHRPPKDKKN